MNAMAKFPAGLLGRLPRVRGKYESNALLGKLTWFRVGGPAEVLFRPADEDDLAEFLVHKPHGVPVTVIGVGSNLLIRDGGVPGVVVRLGEPFARIDVNGAVLRAGAGASNLRVANAARDAARAGLEFLSGIPGSIGGAVRMNAGAFEAEISDVLDWAEALDGAGRKQRVTAAELGFGYRHSGAPDDWIFTAAGLRTAPGDKAIVGARMDEIQKLRTTTQPTKTPTGGSTFVNPPGEKAWELIDRAGCRGLTRGGAQVSPKHCNFLVNTGNATADDIESLGETVRARVRDKTGIELQWEIRRIGVEAVP